ncbi:MAG: DNA polymerase III subunit gamma/tau [candidate division NC10 bacterium]|nr:DNA polymerase III subunit gamma/tau [candidate division NC10 bacterium]
MSYLVLARKWRPQSFQEVVGQGLITQTLMNALSANRVAHAYLFSGPRGVGKTTTARILAKALNCEMGVSREPCNSCPSCQDIAQGRHLDVIEIDGASNRGIDEVRELRENVRFSPYRGRYKVVVIDEVHMLTEPAFNALLKTLEEPPSRVVFILATTEAHKVPTTILSRCQRFEFRRIPSAEILKRLQQMVREEGIESDPGGLEMIARSAEGSLRDAQSLLDQVVSFGGSRVRAEDVMTLLGAVDRRVVEKAAEYIFTGDGKALLLMLDEVHSAGHDLRLFGMSLLELIRDLMMAQALASDRSSTLLDGEISEELRKKAAALGFPELDRLVRILIQAEMDMRRSPYPRLILEMALLRMTEGKRVASLEEIWKRLCQMEERLSASQEGARPRPPLEKGAEIPPTQAPARGEAEGSPANWLQDPRWMEFKRIIKREKISLAPLLEHFSLVSPRGSLLMIGIEGANSYLSETLEDPQNRKILEGGIRSVFGEELKIRYEFGKSAAQSTPRPAASSDSVVEKALEMFEGRVIKS